MKIAILGAGKVGRSLDRALRARGQAVTLRALRRGVPRRPIAADLLVLAVRDPQIAPLARELAARHAVARGTAVVHVAGALGPEVLAPLAAQCAGVAQAHPLVSFASASHVPTLRGAHLLVDGDRVAVARARRLARALGMVARRWTAIDRATYHAAAGLVANSAVALAAAGAQLLERAGAPRRDIPRVLGPLLASVAENIARVGLPGALTGPVRRGDHATVRAHLRRIDEMAPGLRELYVAGARAQLPLARAIGDADARALRAVERALRGRNRARRP